jgi:hypothetical protein
VDSVPDPLLLRKSGSVRNGIWISGSVARLLDYRGGRPENIVTKILHLGEGGPDIGVRKRSNGNKFLYKRTF